MPFNQLTRDAKRFVGYWAAVSTIVALTVGVACDREARRPNVVVITLDTFRADALGIYGNAGDHSPKIDAFAAEAVVFENAVAPMGTTFPSHSTIFTGLYPKHHGVRWNGDSLDERFSTLGEFLSGAGYETAAFVSVPSMLTRGGLHQGISAVSDSGGAGTSSDWLRNGDEINERALPWLAAQRDRPFFLWLHYFETHKPYRATPFARQRLTGYRLPDGVELQNLTEVIHDLPWTPELLRALRTLYDGEVREVDRLVGEVLDALRRQGRLSDTIVIITADHGECLGEHGRIGHGIKLWQPVLHVPWVMRVPGVRPRRIASRVGLVDVTPTLLELLRLPKAPGVDGKSLVPLIAGKTLATGPYFAEVRAPGNMLEQKQNKVRDPERLVTVLSNLLEKDLGAVAVFDGNIKGIWNRGEFHLFDLSKDPRELDPRNPAPADLPLRELVSSYHDDAVIDSANEISEEVRKELKALGYLH